MAPSLSGARLLSALVVDGFSVGLSRRGYAAAAQGVASDVVKGSAAAAAAARSGSFVKKTGDEKVGTTEKVSWVPDPVTGYYRPENLSDEIDVAELRATLLKNKN